MSEEETCMLHLQKLRDQWLLSHGVSSVPDGLSSIKNTELEILKTKFVESISGQKNSERILVLFELSRKALIGSVHYCIGAELHSGGQASLLSQEDLWEEGIP